MNCRILPGYQRGVTLVVGMVMLLLITLMVVAAFNLSTTSLKAANNMQVQNEAVAASNAALEQVISSSTSFSAPSAQTITVGGFTVTVEKPVCLYSVDAPSGDSSDPNANIYSTDSGGGSITTATAFKNTYWDITAKVNDSVTGAVAEVHQGIKISLPTVPNPCP